MIQGIIFDLGNTLIQFKSNWDTVVYEGTIATADWYAKKRRMQVDREALIEAILVERRAAFAEARKTLREALMSDILRRALQRIKASPQAEALIEQALRAFFAPEEEAHDPFPDAVDTLKRLRAKNFKVGILSNAPDNALIQRLVNDNQLRPWVSPVFSSAGIGWRKPMLHPLRLIAKRWQLAPHHVVVVGDTLNADILGAKNAGMSSILATMAENETNDQYRFIRPDRMITTLGQLPQVVDEMNELRRKIQCTQP